MSTLRVLRKTLLDELRQGHFTRPAVIVLAGVGGLVWIHRYTLFLKRKVVQNKSEKRPKQQTSEPETHHHNGHHHHTKHNGSVAAKDSDDIEFTFWNHIRRILPIIIPRIMGKEMGFVFLLGVLLTVRTALSSIIADLSGRAAGFLVSKRVDLAVRNLAFFIAFSIPASYVNGLLRYLTTRLSLEIRTNLNKYIHERYLRGVTFYNICNLGEFKVDNVAERITVEIEHFSEEFSEIYTSTFKPIMDILFFTYKLSESTTWRGPMILYSYFFFSSLCKMILDPNLGKLNAKESQLQGDFRSAHERLITNSEEVAFYDGSKRERTIINKKLDQLHDQVIINSLSHLFIHVVDNVIVKYWASLIGYVSIFSPILFGISSRKTEIELAEDYARNSRYLSSLSDAIGSFVLLGNKISELRGHVHRVGEVIAILDHIEDTVHEFNRKPPEQREFTFVRNDVFLKHWRERCDNLRHHEHHSSETTKVGSVTCQEGDHILFEHIDIISPEGKVLVEDLTFSVRENQNVMVTGPNGCGKSSLFRIIGDLWPPSSTPGYEGKIIKPKKTDIVFIPQKPYLVLGTLRDQIIYPHSKEEMKAANVNDEDLAELLRIVDPKEYILKTWQWDDEKDWFHAFSGGQKQRVAMARLFYHRPRFAILDECTSAVSDEVEDMIYQSARMLGITLFTVSHRQYLKKHHEFMLTIEGKDGKWNFSEIQ